MLLVQNIVLNSFLNFLLQCLGCCLPLHPSEVTLRTERFKICYVRWKRFTLNHSHQYASEGDIILIITDFSAYFGPKPSSPSIDF